MSSPHCKRVNEKIVCPKKWSCPAAEKPDITKLKIAIPPTAVPAMETTYICYNKKVILPLILSFDSLQLLVIK